MKRFLTLFLFLALLSCKDDDNRRSRNPFLLDTAFSFDINLATNSNLSFTGNSQYFSNAGIGGIIVFNSGIGYIAWEASCPNHVPNNCSTMAINGVEAQCSCEDYRYTLGTGDLLNPPGGDQQVYPMLNYRATESGGIITVSN
ncbi:Rieske (2Fe-2S) protein [Spongiivirga citrea]|uniref:Rieske domain-containing protein n=1 Tax=Spongiivirga citrea TaxID=1481457 RepID=A0A6M0CGL0_9FLAO|nr:hypothetical protein [Spongiivirga citrea]NER16991.1 hypothetical protein [Spongiivirga citrea]